MTRQDRPHLIVEINWMRRSRLVLLARNKRLKPCQTEP
jgi:hypothetical protein